MKKKTKKKTRINYLNKNSKYWEKGYHAPNVESFVFRFYGRILVNDFNNVASLYVIEFQVCIFLIRLIP